MSERAVILILLILALLVPVLRTFAVDPVITESRSESLTEALVWCESLPTPADVLDCKDAAYAVDWK